MPDYRFDTDLLALLPPWYREILDYQQICGAESAQFEALAESINAVYDNFFFQTMDEAAVLQWEQIFRIIADPTTESLDFRRARLINRVSSQPPYTMNFLRKKLDELIGEGNWTVRMDYANYTLYIESSAVNQQYEQEVAVTIGKIKPAHIVYVNTPYVTDSMLLNETVGLSVKIYNYKLGAWGLGLSPFASLEDKGVIKVATTPSLQSTLLAGTAAYVLGQIASARVNGTVAISSINKAIDEDTVTVTYTVDAASVSAITSVELLDGNGNVLTSATVYVPVTENTIMKHVITVEEGTNNGN